MGLVCYQFTKRALAAPDLKLDPDAVDQYTYGPQT